MAEIPDCVHCGGSGLVRCLCWPDNGPQHLVYALQQRAEATEEFLQSRIRYMGDQFGARVADLEAQVGYWKGQHAGKAHSVLFYEGLVEEFQGYLNTQRIEAEAHLLEQRARLLSLLESAADRYPESIFPSPPPGEHGTVDCCSARAIRRFLVGLVAEVREMLEAGR